MTSGDASFTAKASAALSALHDGAKVLLTTSGTHALELSALALGLGPGDEVVLPSFTFSADRKRLLLYGVVGFGSPTSILVPSAWSCRRWKSALTPATRAIVTVAYGGVLRDVDGLVEYASSSGCGWSRTTPMVHSRECRATARHIRGHFGAELPRHQKHQLR